MELRYMSIRLSEEQERGADAVIEWREAFPAGRQTFMFGGYAGTGKTTLLSHLVNILPQPIVCTPTGKASDVLRSKGVDSQTIHRTIYEYSGDTVCRKKSLRGKTLIVDEASMVNLQLLKDLCAFNLPVLFFGDHGQLEPIGSDPQIMARCQFRLEEIHRQALDNPIIRLSKAWRENRYVPYWTDPQGRCAIIPKREAYKHLHDGHQVICGYNKSRVRLNNEIRKYAGRGPLPEVGERLMIVQNNVHFDVFNGQMCEVVGVYTIHDKTIELDVRFEDGRIVCAPFILGQFHAEQTLKIRPKRSLLAMFGNAINAHKSQGSEYDSVLIIEEIHPDWDPCRWRYTTTTRGKKRVIYAR